MSTTLERHQYGFDRDSRRTWRRGALSALEDNHYGYDGLGRVVSDALGSLNLNTSTQIRCGAPLVSLAGENSFPETLTPLCHMTRRLPFIICPLSAGIIFALSGPDGWGFAKTIGSTKLPMLDSLASQYAACTTSREKLMFAIDLVDREKISRGKPISMLSQIFAGDVFVADGNLASTAKVFVHFAPPQPSSKSSTYAVPFVGWYLYATSDNGGNIVTYQFSNLHK